MCRYFIVCIQSNMLPLVTQLSIGEGLMPLTGLTPSYVRDCPKPGPGFTTSCVVWSFFLYSFILFYFISIARSKIEKVK